MARMVKKPLKLGKSGCSCSMPGVWQAVGYNPGAAVIYHSPKGCGHLTGETSLRMYYHSWSEEDFVKEEYIAPLVVSGLREEHSIFGGDQQLHDCIAEVIAKYQPQYLVIANSCVAGVIGDDVQAVALEAEEKWQIPVLTVPTWGFLEGNYNYHAGFYHTGRALMEEFMGRQPKLENSVTVLGDRTAVTGMAMEEMKTILQYFSLQIQSSFPTHASLEALRRIPSSSCSILLGGTPQSYSWMRKLGLDLEELLGVPFFDAEYPVGWQTTQKWLEKLGKFLQQEEAALLAKKEQEKRLQQALEKMRGKVAGARAVLCLGRPLLYFQPDWLLELLELAQISLAGIILLEELTEQQEKEIRVELNKLTGAPIVREADKAQLWEKGDFLLTTREEKDHQQRQLLLPLPPPVGVGGLLFFLEKITRLLQRPGQRGGIIYG